MVHPSDDLGFTVPLPSLEITIWDDHLLVDALK
jgi:hypothetical protein